ncbi:telomerase inhibitor [Pestalotiopsis sp. 9143b]|nr:telomerase inhibitor [Pestalotiopsis sp. 9143b]
MGLAGKKNKRKLNEDPNNTKWSRDETTFGQKILRAHGWQPGQYLGAQDAAHASMHSKASSAPIKITIKDDNLGLGAKIRQKQAEECVGLDIFKDLLGRLNGESDESIAKKQAVRSEIKTSLYVERKFGPMRFVKGGLLVGDQITELLKQNKTDKAAETTESSADNTDDAAQTKPEKKEKKSKKRKAEDTGDSVGAETDSAEGKKKKKKKRSKDDAAELEQEQSSDAERKRRKKEKKEKKAKEAQTDAEDDSTETKSKSKKDKKDKKKRKEAKSDEPSEESAELSKKEKKKKRKQQEEEAASASTTVTVSAVASGVSTPTGTGTSTPQPLSRHMVRSRNIASKRMAMGDMAALQQIFMVKPV